MAGVMQGLFRRLEGGIGAIESPFQAFRAGRWANPQRAA